MKKKSLPTSSNRFGIGKEIGGAVYIHKSCESCFGSLAQAAKLHLPDDFQYHVLKLNLKTQAISFICCEDFDQAHEPEVGDSILVRLDGTTRKRSKAKDPEIYHHKWLFVAADYQGFDIEASRQRSRAWMAMKGLDMRKIGKKSYWTEQVLPLLDQGNKVGEPPTPFARSSKPDSELARPNRDSTISRDTEIHRHRTAIKRGTFSKPVKCLLRDGLLNDTKSFFDYGCGHGRDLKLLDGIGINCGGWDPAFRPKAKIQNAKVVNIGYVINVIEDQTERKQAVLNAWKLAEEVLCIAAQIEFAAPNHEQKSFGDGCLTSRGTFQKYYNQHELREYLQDIIGTDAISAAPGIFYLFKCEEAKQQFLANRYQRRYTVPQRRISELLFDQNKEILEPFMERLTQLGRIPLPEEYPEYVQLIEQFGSVKRAFKLIQKVTEESPWEEIAQKRSEDLLVYLALSRFRKRPPLSKLPPGVRRDIKEFLGGYKVACARADTLLFRAGDSDAIDEACQRATVGQLVDNALIIHKSCLEHLEPLLRIYEGCARALVGDLDEANVIKLHRFSGKVSYITYANFEKDPFPTLVERMKVSLRSLNIDWFDYSDWDDPYLLMSKGKLVPPTHQKAKLFSRLLKKQNQEGIQSDQSRKSELVIWLNQLNLRVAGHDLQKTR